MSDNEMILTAAIPTTDEITGKIVVTLEGQDFQRDLEYFSLTMESEDSEIMDVINPVVQEQFGVSIEGTYKIHKALNSNNVYIIPNSTAG